MPFKTGRCLGYCVKGRSQSLVTHKAIQIETVNCWLKPSGNIASEWLPVVAREEQGDAHMRSRAVEDC